MILIFLWIIAAFSAYFIKGLCGFANTLVFTSIMAFSEVNAVITPVDLLVGSPANAIIAWHYRHETDWHVWLPLMIILILGSIPSIYLLKTADSHVIKLIFGFVVIVLGTEMLLLEHHPTVNKINKLIMLPIGLLSGVLCGLFGIGALLAVYVSHASTNYRAFKGKLNIVFLLESLSRAILYTVTGIFTWPIVYHALIVFPFMLLGLFLGTKSSTLLNEKNAKLVVIIMLIVSGVVLIAMNLPVNP